MRISNDPADRAYDPQRAIDVRAILLDGIETRCITADEEAGECLCEILDERGMPTLTADGDAIAREIRRGKVEIRF